MQTISDALSHIIAAALKRVDPYTMIRECVSLDGGVLRAAAGGEEAEYDLDRYNRIVVLGAGKATAPMVRALEEILGDRLSDGVIAVKPGHTAELKKVRQIEAGHPVPNDGSEKAAQAVVRAADEADERTLVITCISGGGSALLAMPRGDLSLEELQSTTEELLRCGAAIEEINCIRKHLSGIKGGRLAEKIYPADSLNLILSDVVGDDLSSIASGITSPDPTTYADALGILAGYGIESKVPKRIRELLETGAAGRVPETPKPGDKIFDRTRNILIGTNALALRAAEQRARELGYTTAVLTSRLTGEAREAAKFFSGIAQDTAASEMLARKPACILAGGETTVTLKGKGKGGRNQEMALAFLREMSPRQEAFKGVLFASVATDGNDGPTDAAGAVASPEILGRAEKAGLDTGKYLADNDAYHFFEAVDGLIKTGPTNTNVCDIQILLVE
jgi:glycerate 2-kinase